MKWVSNWKKVEFLWTINIRYRREASRYYRKKQIIWRVDSNLAKQILNFTQVKFNICSVRYYQYCAEEQYMAHGPNGVSAFIARQLQRNMILYLYWNTNHLVPLMVPLCLQDSTGLVVGNRIENRTLIFWALNCFMASLVKPVRDLVWIMIANNVQLRILPNEGTYRQ